MQHHDPTAAPLPVADAVSPAPQVRRAWRSVGAVMLFILVVVGVLAADLALKQWAFGGLVGPEPVRLSRQNTAVPRWTEEPRYQPVVIPHVLRLKLATNPGAVFGMGRGHQTVFIVVSIVAAVVVLYVFGRSRARHWLLHVALALIMAGAMGNLYDRVRFGVVRDMLWLFPGTGLWPYIFNVADMALVVGVSLLVLIMWNADRQPATTEASEGGSTPPPGEQKAAD